MEDGVFSCGLLKDFRKLIDLKTADIQINLFIKGLIIMTTHIHKIP